MIETRKDEVVLVTDDPKIMLNMFLYENVCRTWFEDCINENTGEVVSVERKEIVLQKGTLLDKDNISEFMFFIQSGDIETVTVSNQRRRAKEGLSRMSVWLITNYLHLCEENSVKADVTHKRRVKFSYEIEKINQIPLSYFIPKEFSLAYEGTII